jgi:hypothetical protein
MQSETKSLAALQKDLKLYQRRLNSGDSLPPISKLANIAGVHRDTLYALLAGDRVNQRSQYAISKALTELMESQWNKSSRLLSIDLGTEGPKLRFGLAKKSIFN